MYTKHAIVGMYCETPLHAGSGQAVGVVDLPVQREKITNWPTIQASGLKGAFRSAYENTDNSGHINDIFGSDNSGDQAGAVSIGDARLLLFPIRSSVAPFLWVICPAILRKLKRDGKIVGKEYAWTIPNVQGDQYLGLSDNGMGVIFEDLMLSTAGSIEQGVLESIKELLPGDDFYNTSALEKHLCIVSDSSFSLLVETGTEVQARIVLNDRKTSENLWYQELVPSNTVFYTVISMANARKEKDEERINAEILMESIRDTLKEYVQIGGDETLGRGWTRLLWQEVK